MHVLCAEISLSILIKIFIFSLSVNNNVITLNLKIETEPPPVCWVFQFMNLIHTVAQEYDSQSVVELWYIKA